LHAELTLGRGVRVGHGAVELPMYRAGLQGLTGRPKFRKIANVATASDRVERSFGRPWRRCGQPGAARVADSKSRHRGERGVVPLVRGVRRLPRILEPSEVEALMAALRTERDWAMVQAMLLVGLRGCELLGLRLEDLRLGEWRVFIAEGKGGHQRLVPVSQTFFDRRPLPQQRTTRGRVDGARVRRAEGPNAWRRIVERRTRRDVDQRDPGRPADAPTRC
jgi:integrase